MSKSMSDFDDLRLEGGRLEDGRGLAEARAEPPALSGGSSVRVAKGAFPTAKLAPLGLTGGGASQEPIGILEGGKPGLGRKGAAASTPHLPQVTGAPPVMVSTYAAAKPLQ